MQHNRIRSHIDTTYPREGTETCTGVRRGQGKKDTTYPREGTETWMKAAGVRAIKTQLIPARGRKPRSGGYTEIFYDTTYPREGTETAASSGCITATCDTTYPREGTETDKIKPSQKCVRTQLIPARGRKPQRGRGSLPLGHRTQLIPARGRKLTSALLFCLCCRT